jgi:hypothetical protein
VKISWSDDGKGKKFFFLFFKMSFVNFYFIRLLQIGKLSFYIKQKLLKKSVHLHKLIVFLLHPCLRLIIWQPFCNICQFSPRGESVKLWNIIGHWWSSTEADWSQKASAALGFIKATEKSRKNLRITLKKPHFH